MTVAAGAPDLRAAAFAIPLLAVVTAIIVAVEFSVVGLLPLMARDLGVSLGQAGQLVSAFAFAAAVLGPPLTLALTRVEPRRTLAAAAAVFGIGNLAAALAPDFRVLLLVRVVEGAVLPAFVSIGALAVARLVGAERQGRSLAQVNIGTIVGLVVALPAAVALAAASDWRTVFASLGAASLAAAIALQLMFPAGLAGPRAGLVRQASVLRSPLFAGHLALSAAVFAAMFAAYAYLAAFLEAAAGYAPSQVALALMGFGALGLVGNWIAGRTVGRWPTAGTAVAVAVVGLAAAAISAVGGQSGLLLPLLAVWGVAHGAEFVLCQVRVMAAGARAPAFAMSLNIAACNLGIALGAEAGAVVVERAGVGGIGIGATGFTVLALALAAWVWSRARRGTGDGFEGAPRVTSL